MVVESLDTNGKVAAFGSGVVIAPGQVITNRHVIEDGVSFRIEHGGKKWPAKLTRVDPDHDLAELSVAGLGVPVVAVRDSSKLAVGETVYAIGAPEGLELTISEGLISGLRDFDKGRVIQTSAAISPGSSGGGLFDAQGRLVGITTFYLKEGQSLNFALPAEWTLALNRQPPSSPAPANKNSPTFQTLVWAEIGDKAMQSGEYSKAVCAYQQVVRLMPELAATWVVLGNAYFRLGQFDKAVSAEQQALRRDPENAGAWSFLGVAYALLGEPEKSVNALQEAVRIKPDDARAWKELGLAYSELGQNDKWVRADDEAVQLKPEDADAWMDMGMAYKALGQRSEVIKVYEKLKTLDPKLADKFFKAAVLP